LLIKLVDCKSVPHMYEFPQSMNMGKVTQPLHGQSIQQLAHRCQFIVLLFHKINCCISRYLLMSNSVLKR